MSAWPSGLVLNLILLLICSQPILALSGGQYQIWNEEYLWQSSYDYQSAALHVVQHGDVVQMQLELFKEESLFRLMCRRVSSSSKDAMPLPSSCSTKQPIPLY